MAAADWHLAGLWEALADRFPQRTALVHGGTTRSFGEYEDRAARLATELSAAGLGPNCKIALYCQNRPEYLEAQFAAFKIGAVPINVNYHYAPDELYELLEDSDAEALFYEARYIGPVAAVCSRLTKLRLLVQITDESQRGTAANESHARLVMYDTAVTDNLPHPREKRSADEIYMVYTGGTTGRPKGVMYRHGEFTEGLMAEYINHGLPCPANVQQWLTSIDMLDLRSDRTVMVVGCPFMHATGMWIGAMIVHALGGIVVTVPATKFDPDELWKTVQRVKATHIVIVGDAFAKPMLAALDRAADAAQSYDLSSLRCMVSSGAMWSTEVKQALLARHEMTLIDAIGSTEGSMGISILQRGQPDSTAHFCLKSTTRVFTDEGRPVAPGSGIVGKLATSGVVPVGYYKDPEKSAATFRTIDGVRYAFPGDHATVEADGSITLLGRGSQCINTAGEKIYPEEVEEAIKRHPAVLDCLVVGVADDRFGERVAAVVAFRSGHSASAQEIESKVRESLAGYKVPRLILPVASVRRLASGKPDYKWAKAVAAAASRSE